MKRSDFLKGLLAVPLIPLIGNIKAEEEKLPAKKETYTLHADGCLYDANEYHSLDEYNFIIPHDVWDVWNKKYGKGYGIYDFLTIMNK